MSEEFKFPETKCYLITVPENCWYTETFDPSTSNDEYCVGYDMFMDALLSCKPIDPYSEFIDWDFYESGYEIKIAKFQHIVQLNQIEYEETVSFISDYFANKILIKEINEN